MTSAAHARTKAPESYRPSARFRLQLRPPRIPYTLLVTAGLEFANFQAFHSAWTTFTVCSLFPSRLVTLCYGRRDNFCPRRAHRAPQTHYSECKCVMRGFFENTVWVNFWRVRIPLFLLNAFFVLFNSVGILRMEKYFFHWIKLLKRFINALEYYFFFFVLFAQLSFYFDVIQKGFMFF